MTDACALEIILILSANVRFSVDVLGLSVYVMLCYVMLCYVMLCYVMLCYVMLCYVHALFSLNETTKTSCVLTYLTLILLMWRIG
jgi:hypothetical protein